MEQATRVLHFEKRTRQKLASHHPKQTASHIVEEFWILLDPMYDNGFGPLLVLPFLQSGQKEPKSDKMLSVFNVDYRTRCSQGKSVSSKLRNGVE